MTHALLLLVAPPVRAPKSAPRLQSFVELSIDEHGGKHEEVPHHAELPDAPKVVTARSRPTTKAPVAQRKEAGAAPLSTMAQAAALSAPSAAAAPKGLNLMPQASALATTVCGRLDKRAEEDCDASNLVPTLGAAQQALNESLNAAANRPAYRSQRQPPKLLPAADGGYDYAARSHAGAVSIFRAHIAADGAVRFEDGAQIQTAPIPIGGWFDIANALQPGELHTAEKRWFLEQTAELRARLADAARTAEERRAQQMIERALERIRTSAVTSKAKREAIFELWMGCDEVGQQRAHIAAWIRAHMPQGTELAFSQRELLSLNRGRTGAARFDPYGR